MYVIRSQVDCSEIIRKLLKQGNIIHKYKFIFWYYGIVWHYSEIVKSGNIKIDILVLQYHVRLFGARYNSVIEWDLFYWNPIEGLCFNVFWDGEDMECMCVWNACVFNPVTTSKYRFIWYLWNRWRISNDNLNKDTWQLMCYATSRLNYVNLFCMKGVVFRTL